MYQSLVNDFVHTSTVTLEVKCSAKIPTLEAKHLPFDGVLSPGGDAEETIFRS